MRFRLLLGSIALVLAAGCPQGTQSAFSLNVSFRQSDFPSLRLSGALFADVRGDDGEDLAWGSGAMCFPAGVDVITWNNSGASFSNCPGQARGVIRLFHTPRCSESPFDVQFDPPPSGEIGRGVGNVALRCESTAEDAHEAELQIEVSPVP